MIRRRRIVLDAKEGVEVDHELGLELGSTIVDDLLRNTMQTEHMITEQLGHAFGSQGRGGGNRMHLFGIAINYDANGIMRVRDR